VVGINGPIADDAVVSPLRFTTSVEKSAALETWSVYVAPVTAFQLRVGLRATSTAPFAGKMGVGNDPTGSEGTVVNENTAE
jgi:hypothetical protein